MEEKGVFISFLMLGDYGFNINDFVSQFKKDWNISLKKSENSKENTDLFETENMLIGISYVDSPLPLNLVEEQAKRNQNWDEAIDVAKNHKAQLMVAIAAKEGIKDVEKAKLHVKVTASLTKIKNVIGVNILGIVMKPSAYYDYAKDILKNSKSLPLLVLVYIGIYSNDEGKTLSAYTYGLSNFGKKELEIISTNESPEYIYELLNSISYFVIENNVELNVDETINYTNNREIKLSISKAIAVDGESIKLEI